MATYEIRVWKLLFERCTLYTVSRCVTETNECCLCRSKWIGCSVRFSWTLYIWLLRQDKITINSINCCCSVLLSSFNGDTYTHTRRKCVVSSSTLARLHKHAIALNFSLVFEFMFLCQVNLISTSNYNWNSEYVFYAYFNCLPIFRASRISYIWNTV